MLDCRHTFSTSALIEGHPVEKARKIMGHSGSRVTVETYARPFPHHNDLAINAVDEGASRRIASTGTIAELPSLSAAKE
jgi:hypothetical protein